jgi:pyruvate-ferredoxin/flavodoxin oxidoreductase
VNAQGCGPSWSNSLFEDNAEFGMGMRFAVDKQFQYASELLHRLSGQLGDTLVGATVSADQSTEAGIVAQRARVAEIKRKLSTLDSREARDLLAVADALVLKSVWIVGGDGWAYDIGAGGLDHVLGSGVNVNVLVLDTEVYSNTGGQMSKATPRAAVAKFASGGKATRKKDLAMEAISYGSVYVARVDTGHCSATIPRFESRARIHSSWIRKPPAFP